MLKATQARTMSSARMARATRASLRVNNVLLLVYPKKRARASSILLLSAGGPDIIRMDEARDEEEQSGHIGIRMDEARGGQEQEGSMSGGVECPHQMRCCSTAVRVAALRELTASLLKMEATCLLTVGRLSTSRSAIWGLVNPWANKRSTSLSRAVRP